MGLTDNTESEMETETSESIEKVAAVGRKECSRTMEGE